MVKKNQVIKNISLVLVVLILMALIIFLVGKSFGFFTYVKKGETVNVITINGIDIRITQDNNALNLEDAYPVYDSQGLGNSPFVFTMENTTSKPLAYTLKVENDTEKQEACYTDSEETEACKVLSTSYIRYSYKQGDGTYSEPATLGPDNIITTGIINSNETITTSIKLWISSDARNDIQNSYFFGKLVLEGTQSAVSRCDTSSSANDVSMWLSCGNINNKNYTTISEVLNDTDTLQALINSNQANDYLALSTDWASDITANEEAMQYIGANNYSADTLIADSTWLDAIANSTYFESVLNVKVPTMTSNTTPSGECFGLNAYDSIGYSAYKAFDGDDSEESRFASAGNDTNGYGWIGYHFTTPVVVHKYSHGGRPRSNMYIRLQGSNDGTNWIDLDDEHAVSNAPLTPLVDRTISNSTPYSYYRLYSRQTHQEDGRTLSVSLSTVQFYGRKDVE